MTTINDGGFAFPSPLAISPAGDTEFAASYSNTGGMTLRDWFAGHALTGLVPIVGVPENEPDKLWNTDMAKQAYALADAMLVVRNHVPL